MTKEKNIRNGDKSFAKTKEKEDNIFIVDQEEDEENENIFDDEGIS